MGEKKDTTEQKLRVVAIGASAGGLKALQSFFSYLPDGLPLSFLIVQHLSPDHKSKLAELLSKNEKYTFCTAQSNQKLKAQQVYVSPEGYNLMVKSGKIFMQAHEADQRGPLPSIDACFESLAQEKNLEVAGILLSGAGTDGTAGAVALQRAGHIVLAQDPDEAAYKGLPKSAIHSKTVDFVAPLKKLADYTADFSRGNLSIPEVTHFTAEEGDEWTFLDQVIQILRRHLNRDLRHYKTPTLLRRIAKRMAQREIKSEADYLKLIERDKKEREDLAQDVLIGVTNFFRDQEAFDQLEKVLKERVDEWPDNQMLRIWVPGCFTGEEAVSIAVLLQEKVLPKKPKLDWQIFATDINEKAIEQARQGIFRPDQINSFPKSLVKRYFRKEKGQYRLVKKVRSKILYTVHDLQSDPPFLHLDLISCRNLLIYLDNSLQSLLIDLFHYALDEKGLLFLGKSESVPKKNKRFKAIHRAARVYQSTGVAQKIVPQLFDMPHQSRHTDTPTRKKNQPSSLEQLVGQSLIDQRPDPLVIIDRHRQVIQIYGEVGEFMQFPSGNFPLDLLKLVKKDLRIALRTAFNQALKQGEWVKSSLQVIPEAEPGQFMRFQVVPLAPTGNEEDRFAVLFDRENFQELQPEKSDKGPDKHLKNLEFELATTKEHLQTYIEELESSNEELQTLNEELQSSSEETQSLNEELETSNEELQSTNQEKQVAFQQLEQQNQELKDYERSLRQNRLQLKALSNNDLQGLILVDKEAIIQIFNKKAKELYRSLFKVQLKSEASLWKLLDNKHHDSFRKNFQEAQEGRTFQAEQSLTDQEGQTRFFRVQYTPVGQKKNEVDQISIALMDITEMKETLRSLNQKERMIESIFNTVESGIVVLDAQGRIVELNEKFCQIFAYKSSELIHNKFQFLVAPEARDHFQEYQNIFFQSKKGQTFDFRGITSQGQEIELDANDSLLQGPGEEVLRVIALKDVTKMKEMEAHQQAIQSGLPGVSFRYILHPDGRDDILWLSGNPQKLWGLSAKEVRNNTSLIWAKVHPEDLRKVQQSVQISARHMSPWDIQFRVIQEDGTINWHHGIGAPQKHANGIVFWNTLVLDITDRQEARIALTRSEERLREAVNLIQLGYYELEVESQKMHWSDQVYNILGIDPKTNPSLKLVRALVHKKDLQHFDQVVNQIKEEEAFDAFEFRIYKNEEIRWLQAKGRLDKNGQSIYKGTLQDISEERQEQESLRLMSSVVKNSADPILITDTDRSIDGPHILYANASFCAMSGYRKEELLGASPKILQGPDTDPLIIQKMSACLDQWQGGEFTLLNYRKNGELFWNRFKMIPVKDDQQRVTHFIAIERDVTEQVEREAQTQLYQNISNVFSSEEDLGNAYQFLCQKLIDSVFFDVAELWLVDEGEKFMQLKSFAAANKSVEAFHSSAKELKLGQGLPGRVWATAAPIHIDNIDESPFVLRKESMKRSGLGNFYALPLFNGEKTIGCLFLGTKGTAKLHRKFRFLFEHVELYLGAEIAQKQLQEDLKTIYDTVPDIICTANLDGYFLRINKAASSLLGYELKELRSLPITSFVHPDDVAKTQKEMQLLRKGSAPQYFENRYITKAGQVIWLAWTASVDLEKKRIYAVAKNISQEKDLQVLLDEATMMAQIGAFRFELQEGIDDFQWSPMASKFHLKPPGFFSHDQAFLQKVYPNKNHRALMQSNLQAAAEDNESFDVEVKAIGKDGALRWLRIIGEPIVYDGRCIAVRGSIQNIHMRKMAEEQALEMLREKQIILESIGDAFIGVDQQNCISYWNQKAENWLGIPREDALRKKLKDLLPTNHNAALTASMQAARQGKERQQLTLQWKDHHLELNVYPVAADKLSIFIQDVTERVDYLEQIEKRNHKLSEIAQFQSHAVRAPLARIMGLANLLEVESLSEREHLDLIRKVIEASQELDDIIRTIVHKTEVSSSPLAR